MDNKTNFFELLDGSKLDGYLSANPLTPVSNAFAFDTTGQYLSIGRKPARTPKIMRLNDSEGTNCSIRMFHSFLPMQTRS